MRFPAAAKIALPSAGTTGGTARARVLFFARNDVHFDHGAPHRCFAWGNFWMPRPISNLSIRMVTRSPVPMRIQALNATRDAGPGRRSRERSKTSRKVKSDHQARRPGDSRFKQVAAMQARASKLHAALRASAVSAGTTCSKLRWAPAFAAFKGAPCNCAAR